MRRSPVHRIVVSSLVLGFVVEFGDSQPVVRLSTRNGPVSIERAD
jgi:hypothetical protein